MKPISFWHRLLDLISPRLCVVCGQRLSISEEVICAKCNLHLPRTDFHQDPYENEMAKLFWHQIPIERATALFYYEAHSETANILYELKYKNDGIVPIPLAKKRQRQRGYNQSMEIARGVSEVTCLPIYNKVVRRNAFEGSQTNKGRWERNENVEHVFEVEDISAIQGKHLLIVDDVVTTGATVLACAQELCKAPDVKVTILALGFAKS